MTERTLSLLLIIAVTGCATSRPATSAQPVRARSPAYVSTATHRSRMPSAPVASQEPPVSVSSSYAPRGETGSGFKGKLARAKAERERRRVQEEESTRQRTINDFLSTHHIPGVKDARTRLCTAQTLLDRKLVELHNSLRLNGREPDCDSAYVRLRSSRDAIALKLRTLDNQILDIAIAETTGEAARVVAVGVGDPSLQAAEENLQTVAQRYDRETKQLMGGL